MFPECPADTQASFVNVLCPLCTYIYFTAIILYEELNTSIMKGNSFTQRMEDAQEIKPILILEGTGHAKNPSFISLMSCQMCTTLFIP